jgi:GNAT superfamily N-acetyltransferase
MFLAMGIRRKQALDRADRDYMRWAKTNLEDKNLQGWIVEDDNGRLLGSGCLWLRPIQPGPGNVRGVQPYLLSMYTHPKYRRRGVASLIVEKAIEWCERKKFDRLVLHASDTGRKVYTKFGFEPTAEMRLRLPRNNKMMKKIEK